MVRLATRRHQRQEQAGMETLHPGPDDDQSAKKSDNRGGPAMQPDMLAKQQRRHHGDDKRGHEGDRHGVRQRNEIQPEDKKGRRQGRRHPAAGDHQHP